MDTTAEAKLRTVNQIFKFFRNHPDARVLRVMGTYEIWSVENGKASERQAKYNLAELKEWAARW